jgi:hypothetical protein
MNKKQLKETLKPLIKECVKEVIIEDGLLSGIVAEVMVGVNMANAQVITESSNNTLNTEKRKTKALHDENHRRRKIDADRKKMLDAIGNDSYNGVNLFEGTEPLKRGGTPQESSPSGASGPLSGIDPSDAGVDITAFFGKGR